MTWSPGFTEVTPEHRRELDRILAAGLAALPEQVAAQ